MKQLFDVEGFFGLLAPPCLHIPDVSRAARLRAVLGDGEHAASARARLRRRRHQPRGVRLVVEVAVPVVVVALKEERGASRGRAQSQLWKHKAAGKRKRLRDS